ncbi:MAG: DUF4912 domain-containing protein [Candidatus Xenobiia bacterium LiM19]
MFHPDEEGLPQQRDSKEDREAFSEIPEGHDGQFLKDKSPRIACDRFDVTSDPCIPLHGGETLPAHAAIISLGGKAEPESDSPAPLDKKHETSLLTPSPAMPETEARPKAEPQIFHEIVAAAIDIEISSGNETKPVSEEHSQAGEDTSHGLDSDDRILQHEVSVNLQKDDDKIRLAVSEKRTKVRPDAEEKPEDEEQVREPRKDTSPGEESIDEEPLNDEMAEGDLAEEALTEAEESLPEEPEVPEEPEESDEKEESFDLELLLLDTEELPATYDEDRVVILIRDPYKAYAYWDISLEKRIELGLGESSDDLPNGQLYLKVYRGADEEELAANPQIHIEIAIIGSTRSAYFDIDESFQAYYGKLEFVPFFDEPVTVSVSNIISPPPATLTGSFDEEWKAIEKIYKRFYTLVKKELEEDPLLKEVVIEEEMEKLEELTSLAGLDEIEELEELIRTEGPEILDRIEEQAANDRISREIISEMEPVERQNLIRKLKERRQEEQARKEAGISDPKYGTARERDAAYEYGAAAGEKDDMQAGKKEKISLFWIAEDLKMEKSERIRHRQEVLKRLVARYLEHRDLPLGMYGPVFPPEHRQKRLSPPDEVEGAS